MKSVQVFKPKCSLKVQLNVKTCTDFTVGCIVNSFDLSQESKPGFFGGEIKGNNDTSDSEISSGTEV